MVMRTKIEISKFSQDESLRIDFNYINYLNKTKTNSCSTTTTPTTHKKHSPNPQRKELHTELNHFESIIFIFENLFMETNSENGARLAFD